MVLAYGSFQGHTAFLGILTIGEGTFILPRNAGKQLTLPLRNSSEERRSQCYALLHYTGNICLDVKGTCKGEATCSDNRSVKSNPSWSENDQSFEAVDASLFRKASFCKRPVLHNGMSYICFQIAEFGWYRFFSSPESSSFHEEIHINVYTPLPPRDVELHCHCVSVGASFMARWLDYKGRWREFLFPVFHFAPGILSLLTNFISMNKQLHLALSF